MSTGRIVPPTSVRERLEAVDDRLGATRAVGREQALLRHDEEHVRVRAERDRTGQRTGVARVALRGRRALGFTVLVVVMRNE